MNVIEYLVLGLCIWFMVAAIVFLLMGLSPASRDRAPSALAIVLLAPILLVIAMTRPLERGIARILFSRET